jgi:hypothetical protein
MKENSFIYKTIMLLIVTILFYGCEKDATIENQNIKVEFDTSMHSRVINKKLSGPHFYRQYLISTTACWPSTRTQTACGFW